MRSALLFFTALAHRASADVSFDFDAATAANTVDSLYVCYNIDTGSLFNGMDFADTKFRTLVSQLAPSIIRIGGTAVDASYYFPDTPYLVGQINDCASCGYGASAIGNDMLSTVFDFIAATDMSLLWDLNGEMARVGTGPWLPSFNFTPMATFLDAKYGGKIEYAYSVGNEPDLWKINKVNATQLAHDAVTLKRALTSYNIGKDVYGSSFAGVRTEDASAYLPVAAAGGVTGYTVHNYPYGGHNCDVAAYLNKSKVTGDLYNKLASVKSIAKSVAPDMLLVLEEVAGSSGGGCDNVTDRFVAGFAWLTTLATVGASGFSRVHRQDIAGWSFAFGKSNYMLVGPPGWTNGTHETLTPHPDFYTTILWRQLVGRTVLTTTLGGDAENFFASAWCAGARAPYGSGGSVVVAWTNQAATATVVNLPTSLTAVHKTTFLLTAGAQPSSDFASLSSDDMYLNGELLYVDDNGLLPQVPYVGVDSGPAATITVPPYSYGFVVFDTHATDVPACAAAH